MALCPECNQQLVSPSRCNLCGWTKDKPKSRAEEGIDHSRRCSYSFNGETCNRLGTMSPSTKGEGPWLCRDHYFNRRLGARSEQGDWKDKLIDSRINPEDFRQPGEPKSAYRQRMVTNIKGRISAMVNNLPYDKTIKIEADEERAAIQDEYTSVPF